MKSFKKNIYRTASEDPCPDCVAHDVTIGTQIWTGCNATVSTYRDLTPIPYVDDATTWAALTTGAWCYYNDDPSSEATYGKLYNWHAVNDPRGLAPAGYHVPSDAEWTTLTTFLGGTVVAGGKMKESGLCHWIDPNVDATNVSLFTALPGGFRNDSGNYIYIGNSGNWWSSTVNNAYDAWGRNLNYSAGNIYRNYYDNENGLSVRFIKD